MSEDKKQEPKEYKIQYIPGLFNVGDYNDRPINVKEEDLKVLKEHPVIQTPSSSTSAEIIEGIIANHSPNELKDIDVLPPQDVLDQMKAIYESKEGSTEDTQVGIPPVVDPEA